ncbi:unnamed protein product [Brassica oleracea var. botrytis]
MAQLAVAVEHMAHGLLQSQRFLLKRAKRKLLPLMKLIKLLKRRREKFLLPRLAFRHLCVS